MKKVFIIGAVIIMLVLSLPLFFFQAIRSLWMWDDSHVDRLVDYLFGESEKMTK